MIKLVKLNLSSLLWLTSLLPFLSPLPVYSDTQPFFIIFILASFFRLRVYKYFDQIDIIVCTLAGIELLVSFYRFDTLKDILPYVFTILLFPVYRIVANRLSHQIFRFALLINFLGFALQRFFPPIFYTLTPRILRVAKVQSADRFMTGFSPESGLITGLLYFYIFIVIYKFDSFYRTSKKRFVVDLVLLSFCIISSLSGSTIIYSVIFLAAYFLYSFKKVFLDLFVRFRVNLQNSGYSLFILVSSISLFMVALLSNLLTTTLNYHNRFLSVLNVLVKSPTLIFLDPSVSSRYLSILTSFVAIVEHPFGVDSYKQIYSVLAVEYFPGILNNEWALSQGSNSAFAKAVFSFGYIHVVLLLYFCYLFFDKVLKQGFVMSLSFILGFVFHAFGYSTIFPPTWILLALPFSKDLDLRRSMLR